MKYLNILLFGLMAIFVLGTLPSQADAAVDTWDLQNIEEDEKKWSSATFQYGISMINATHGWAAGSDAQIYYTANGGDTWKNQRTGGNPLYSITSVNATHAWAVGAKENIYHTSDGGATWSAQTTPGNTKQLHGVSFVYENNVTSGWAVGIDGIIRHTSDGGATWSAQTSPGEQKSLYAVFFIDAKNGWAVGDGGTIIRTTDGGESWDLQTPVTTVRLTSVSFVDTNNGWAVGHNGVIIHTTDGGTLIDTPTSWIVQTSNTDVTLFGVSFVDANNGLAVGNTGTIRHTTDGGATWIAQTSGTAQGLFGVHLLDVDHGWIAGRAGTILIGTATSISGDPTYSTSGGGSDNEHKSRPTFGIDHKTGSQLVEGGFSFNGVSHDITDNFWTPFAQQEVLVGDPNTFTIKTLAVKQLMVQEFLFGIPEVGLSHEAELGVEIHFNYDKSVEKINVVQKSDVIDVDSVKIITYDSKCTADAYDKKCTTTELTMKFLEPLLYKVMGIKAIDFKNRSQITYLNDGFDVTGKSLNPMVSAEIAGPEKYEGLLQVTQSSKYSNIWVSDDGREFQKNDFGGFIEVNKADYIRLTDDGMVKNRLHSEFADYKQAQVDRATILLLETCPGCFEKYTNFDDSFAYEFPEEVDRLESLNELLKSEANRAEVIMDSYP